MDIMGLLEAKTQSEIDEVVEANPEPIRKKKADPIFFDRQFDLIVKKNGEVIKHHKNLAAATAERWRKEYRNEGYQVDKIEVSTKVSATGKTLEFTEKNYVPALEGRIPATCEMSDQRALEKRIQNHSNMIKKMARNTKVKETVNEDYKIFDKATGNLISKGNEAEIVAYLLDHPEFDIEAHVVYLPNKVYNKLMKEQNNESA